MMKPIALVAALAAPFSAFADAPISMDQLVKQAKRNYQISQKINQAREQQFLESKKKQAQLLKEAKAQLRQAEQKSTQLKKTYDANETRIKELTDRLDERSATLGEVFGAVRQVANDAGGMLHGSMISVQHPERETVTDELANSKTLPSLEKMQALWLGLLEEMTESGKITQFENAVITADGGETKKTVTRIGAFNSFADGKYLRYLPESQKLVELAKQPASRYQEMAMSLETSPSGLQEVGIDPSRGAILSAIVQTPSFWQRIQQGGAIAYIILIVGGIGLAFSIERLWLLLRTGKNVNNQLKSDHVDQGNPLGRILHVADHQHGYDTETMQLKLDEAILKETPKIERGLSTIAVMAAIAPLLGLLGTVTGMIETFTSITIFGTGDPKYMSGGISQALVTTELGLAVSIPIILMHSYLTSRGNRIIQVLDEQSAGLIAKLSHTRSERA